MVDVWKGREHMDAGAETSTEGLGGETSRTTDRRSGHSGYQWRERPTGRAVSEYLASQLLCS